LKKLTSSARGEDAPQFAHDDPPLTVPLKSFIGESTPVRPDVSDVDWNPDEFRRAMETLGAASSSSTAPFSIPPLENGANTNMYPQASLATAIHPSPTVAAVRSNNRKRVVSLLSLGSPVLLLFYFIAFYEPSLYNSYTHIGDDHWTLRWSHLGVRGGNSAARTEGVHAVPFFTAFITVHLIQQISIAILFPVEKGLPDIFAMALPHLPPSARRWTVQLMFFVRILLSLVDQAAVVVFGLGMLIWISGVMSVQ